MRYAETGMIMKKAFSLLLAIVLMLGLIPAHISATDTGDTKSGPVITKQPVDSKAKMGETYLVTVEAEGEGLTYKWYLRDAGTERWYASSVTTNKYTNVMTSARAGRDLYCVITDSNGNSVTSDIAKLVLVGTEELEIVTQPADSAAELGETYAVTVEAKGDGLTYKWYIRNAGASAWSASSVRTNTYTNVMTPDRAGRELYCVITDAYGNSVTTDIARLILLESEDLAIVTQPTDSAAEMGKRYSVSVVAKGKGLTYQWYILNAGADSWTTSSVRTATYSAELTPERVGRELYCVITDTYGNSVTTDTAKLILLESEKLGIVYPPKDTEAKSGETYSVTVGANGKGLTYRWYIRSAGSDGWIETDSTSYKYSGVMTDDVDGSELYCVVTDSSGNSATTGVAKLSCVPTYIWDAWLQPVTMAAGTYPATHGSPSPTGYHAKGQTFSGILYSSTMRDGSDVLWNLNSSTYYSAVANPASLLYTVNYTGHVYNESAWAGSVCSSTALKACGYPYPYLTAEIKELFNEKTDHGIDNMEFGDILWVNGHAAGVVGVNKDADGHVTSVKVIEQANYVKVFEVTSANWEKYFSAHWTTVYRGDFDMSRTAPEEYPENLTIIFERGNNTYVTDCTTMLFYIPSASEVYMTKDGTTAKYAKDAFPIRTVNDTTVYDLASIFDGVGDYWFHTEENTTDICIKVIDQGSITISGTTAELSGYKNCSVLGYRVIRIMDKSKSNLYNFFDAPDGYTSQAINLSFRWLGNDTFRVETIPEDEDGWKLEVYYDTGYGWARALSRSVMMNDGHTHTYASFVTEPDCTAAGFVSHVCETCGKTYLTDEAPALGHDTAGEMLIAVQPDETANGLWKKTCPRCGHVIESREFTLVRGDASGDERVNSKDLIALKKYIIDLISDREISIKGADVNNDGRHNSKDVSELKKLFTQ